MVVGLLEGRRDSCVRHTLLIFHFISGSNASAVSLCALVRHQSDFNSMFITSQGPGQRAGGGVLGGNGRNGGGGGGLGKETNGGLTLVNNLMASVIKSSLQMK